MPAPSDEPRLWPSICPSVLNRGAPRRPRASACVLRPLAPAPLRLKAANAAARTAERETRAHAFAGRRRRGPAPPPWTAGPAPPRRLPPAPLGLPPPKSPSKQVAAGPTHCPQCPGSSPQHTACSPRPAGPLAAGVCHPSPMRGHWAECIRITRVGDTGVFNTGSCQRAPWVMTWPCRKVGVNTRGDSGLLARRGIECPHPLFQAQGSRMLSDGSGWP